MLTSLLCCVRPHSLFICLYKNRWVLSLLFSCFFPQSPAPNPHPQLLPHPLPHCHDKCQAWKLAEIVSIFHLRIFCLPPLSADSVTLCPSVSSTSSQQIFNVYRNKCFYSIRVLRSKIKTISPGTALSESLLRISAAKMALDFVCACLFACVQHLHVHVYLLSWWHYYFTHNPLNTRIKTRMKTNRFVCLYLAVFLFFSCLLSLCLSHGTNCSRVNNWHFDLFSSSTTNIRPNSLDKDFNPNNSLERTEHKLDSPVEKTDKSVSVCCTSSYFP